ncbi:MAG: Crp/Fnr family transcriptional regulator [Candidatus Omnitrophica bacterium]|nr:Crp/Fnr family transcriptional regulator [Candidatus Omnitrophota bacterium]
MSRYPKGAVLFREGEPAEILWVLQRGWVRLVKKTTDSKTLTLDLMTPKDGLCGLSAFSGDRYLASAVAATPVEAVRIPAKSIRAILQSNAPFASCVIGIFSQRFHHMAEAYATAFAPVEQRIASVLLRLDEDFGTTLPVTRRELAELAGTTVETAIRVTNRMRQENLLLMQRKKIILVNPKGLAQKIQTV